MIILKFFSSPLTVFLLSTTLAMTPLATADSASEQRDQPFWQYVLREFVFKSISEPLPDDTLYTKIRDAPFYGGPLPEVSDEDEDALLSRGSVFRVANEQWILCQDNCEKCEYCGQQNTPIVRWALRRVKRRMSEAPPKWDLQLTVLPQLDRIFQADRTSGQATSKLQYPDVQNTESFTQVSTTEGAPLREGLRSRNADWFNRKYDGRAKIPDSRTTDEERRQGHWRQVRSRNDAVTKSRQTEDISVPLALQYSQDDHSSVNSPADKFRDNGHSQLIVGIDQYGEKHLVHVVPMYLPAEYEGRHDYPSSYRRPYQTGQTTRRISRTIHPGWNEAAYDKLINRILDSLETHRNIIETFLFSDRLVPETSKQLTHSSYPFYPGATRGNERLPQDPNIEARYQDTVFRRGNPYPSWYQVDKQDQQYRRYADTTREVNRPTVVHQDQSSELEPYGLSWKDESYGERRAAPREDTERKRRDSRAKLTYSSTVSARQGIEENRTCVDNIDSMCDPGRKFTANSADQSLANRRLPAGQTGTVKL